MSEPFKDECPLCGNKASFALINHSNDYDISCNYCGRFSISIRAMKDVLYLWNEMQRDSTRKQISASVINKESVSIIYNAMTNMVEIIYEHIEK